MSDKKDLVVKMTIDSSDFDSNLKNAKSEMKKTEGFAKNAGASMKAAFGSVAIAAGAATSVVEGFKKVMRSTEQGADSMDRSLHVAKVSVDKFFHSIATGSFDSFIQGLNDITENAREAYNAIDDLGTMKMWSGARIAQLQAMIAEDRVIVNNSNSSESERSAAQNRIALNTEKIKALSGDLAEQTLKAMRAKLREIAGAGKLVSDEALEGFVGMWEAGTLGSAMEEFYARHGQKGTKEIDISDFQTGSEVIEKEIDIFDTEKNRQIYNAMKALSTITEDEGGWKDYYDLVNEYWAQRANLASQQNKSNTLINKGGSSGGSIGSSGGVKSTGLSADQWNEYYARQMQRVPLPLMPYQDLGLPAEDIIEPETDALVEAVTLKMAELVKQTQEAFVAANALGGAFAALGNLAGDNAFGKMASGMGSIISQAVATAQAMMTLAGAETVEGLAETFAKAPPLTKIALTATALAGILSMISTAKNAFAGSFADGGVVGGNSYSGDKLWARVNSGEMILPYDAWHNGGGNVKFVIEGSQLKGVLDNYQSIQSM